MQSILYFFFPVLYYLFFKTHLYHPHCYFPRNGSLSFTPAPLSPIIPFPSKPIKRIYCGVYQGLPNLHGIRQNNYCEASGRGKQFDWNKSVSKMHEGTSLVVPWSCNPPCNTQATWVQNSWRELRSHVPSFADFATPESHTPELESLCTIWNLHAAKDLTQPNK